MTHTPNPNRRGVNITVSALLIPALVAYVFSLSDYVSPLPLQLAALILVCGAVYILIRYRFTRITYILRPRDTSAVSQYGNDIADMPAESVDFVIEKAQGNRQGAVECMISVDRLAAVRDVCGSSWRTEIRQEFPGASLYIYTVFLGRSERQALIFNDGGIVSCIVTELSEEMLLYLRAAAEKNCEAKDRDV